MDKRLVVLMSLFIFSFLIFVSLVFFNKPLTRLSRAKEETIPSPQNSLIFAWPLSSKADGEDTVQINVFVRNMNNAPLENKKVHLETTLGTLRENDLMSEKSSGKATFVLISKEAGIAEIQAIVDNYVSLEKKITIKFN
ncbi:hypothetical protein COT62_02600 [Candidatus Roizmanbacteria bacterium CG09_land_8_20_14_0_10_41_9]|uniref:Big-1 domain-containing protein n=1 Tax=Candidatus Roizmanbacteria bacterium CG09_land_8_20_14_0_10_41_9 TaxID=1974850 RepID=A0A2H0WSP1_9BACT|nr:MAG: hypothetical protein COT62_02600 [Candidatus Roizmanbacteria bacterium CG09_land_8_20_14_0_10_41_9]